MPERKGRGGAGRTRVERIQHDEARRTNIPTNELSSFMVEEAPESPPMLYPRDPTLDPQLVWRGKDEQDRKPLEVPVLPIYIQEKVHPKALIEDLRAHSAADKEAQAELFADFNGIQLEELVEFYQHDQSWTNRMILGDSLHVMTSLAEKEGLKGQVQMIYMDPPYGIRFGSNWQVSTRKRDVKDGKPQDATRQPEQVKAFRDTWELGIHSYLAYLRDRTAAARELLSPSGSMFVQIGDENVHLVRSIMDEVFGSENFVSLITFKKTSSVGSFAGGTTLLASANDYILWYAREREGAKYRPLYRSKSVDGEGAAQYQWAWGPKGIRRLAVGEETAAGERRFRPSPLTSETVRVGQTTVFPVAVDGAEYLPGKGGWKTNREGMEKLRSAQRLMVTGNSLNYVRYLDDFPAFAYTNMWTDTQSGSGMDKVYVVQTNAKVIERCLLMTSDPGDLVLDPTCGSGATAHVAEQWGRRWITVDTSRVAITLARSRLMAARYNHYVLLDSLEGARLASEQAGTHMANQSLAYQGDVRRGFVYRTIPHVTLKSIANHPNDLTTMSRSEVDASIARHAEKEVLYDQPYRDSRVVRVAGPFTVESLSPHVLMAGPANNGATTARDGDDLQRFQRVVIDHLRIAGVQNTVRRERLTFSAVETWPGAYVHAAGDYTEKDRSRRAAISIGPQYGTVDTAWVREAAKEAAGVFDLLIVCGFVFDGYLGQELRRLGSLTILKAAMNPDLSMGTDLLKKTGAANLFMVFGEPDIDVRQEEHGWVVEIKGLDIYDPTTGEIRSHSTDDIACWFVDTEYNAESFFVRHAYFTGGNDPYQQLKRALRADIDEEAWASLYRTVSRPFAAPASGRIAVKVINHYGDEIMQVYPVPPG